MMQARKRLVFAQMAQYLGAAEIFRIVDFNRGSGRSITIHQRDNPSSVLWRSVLLGLMIQIHDSHRCASVTQEFFEIVDRDLSSFGNCENLKRICSRWRITWRIRKVPGNSPPRR